MTRVVLTPSRPRGLDAVAGRILQPALAWRRGHRWRRYLATAERLLARPPDVARQETVRRLRRLLVHARTTVPFYAARMAEAGFDPSRLRRLEDLRALPPLTRNDAAANAIALRSDRWRGRALLDVHSGGTTAEPVPLTQSLRVGIFKDAVAAALRRRMGWPVGARVALLWGAAQDAPAADANAVVRWKDGFVERHIRNFLWLPTASFTPEVLDESVRRIEAFRPHVLQGYPSAVDLLARHLLERGRRLSIPMVLLTAETVFDQQRARIARALGAEVLSFYGAREVGWIAGECRAERRQHVNVPCVHLETGEDGRFLVTDLWNEAQPLLRYEIGDRGVLDPEPCPCGDPRPVLAALHGRVSDVFVLPSGRRVPGVLCDVRNYQLADGIVETQLVQREPGRIEVRWVPAASFRSEQLEVLRGWLEGHFFGEVELRFRRVDGIQPEANGKVRYCISHVGASETAGSTSGPSS